MADDAARFPHDPILISIAAGTFGPPNGVGISYSATSLSQYFDAPLATACFAEAKRLADDAAQRAALDVPLAAASRENGEQQVEYVYKILSWLAAGYNALNIPWFCDPTARQYYRQWIAGPPQGTSEGAQLNAQFSKDLVNYREGWYVAATQWPRIPDAARQQIQATTSHSQLVGLPWAARDMFNRFYPERAANPTDWVQLAGLYLDADDDTTRNPRDYDGSVAYLERVRNRAFAMLASGVTVYGGTYQYVRVDGPAEDPSLHPDFGDPTMSGQSNIAVLERFKRGILWGGVAFDSTPMPPSGVRKLPDGTPEATRGDLDWRYFQYDEAVWGPAGDGVPLKIANPLRDYLPWLAAWTQACTVRAPADILSQARLYILWMNGKTTATNTSAADIIRNDADIRADRDRPDPTASAVFGAVGAIAPAVATVAPPYGAVIALGLAAVSAVGSIVTRLVGSAIDARRTRDDMGLFKPMYVRAQLSGSVRDGVPPSTQIPAPPGWTRSASPILLVLPGLFTGRPATLDGAGILAALGLQPAQWAATSAAEQDRLLTGLGYTDDAARAAAREAIQYSIDPASRPHPYSAPGNGGTALIAGAAALAALWWLARGKR